MPASMLVGSATFRAPCYERVYAPIEAALSRLLAQMTQPTAPAQFAFAHEEIHSCVHTICEYRWHERLLEDVMSLCRGFLQNRADSVVAEREDDVCFARSVGITNGFHHSTGLIAAILSHLEQTWSSQLEAPVQTILESLFPTSFLQTGHCGQRLLSILVALPQQVLMYRSQHDRLLVSLVVQTAYLANRELAQLRPDLFEQHVDAFHLERAAYHQRLQQELLLLPPTMSIHEQMALDFQSLPPHQMETQQATTSKRKRPSVVTFDDTVLYYRYEQEDEGVSLSVDSSPRDICVESDRKRLLLDASA